MTGTNLFGIAPDQDFGRTFLEGLMQRYGSYPPEEFARIEIFVNTRRMQRRLRDLFDDGRAILLPRIRLLTDIGSDPGFAPVRAVSPLRRRLEIAQLIGGLIKADPSFAARASRFDLADSLASLLEEMSGEGVSAEDLANLDVSDQSGHWQRTVKFIALVQAHFGADGGQPDAETVQKRAVETLIHRWNQTPPDHPVIVAGSTGSRGMTLKLMRAVAALANGAVVLPGLDTHMPPETWDKLSKSDGGEDHPQFRFKALGDALGLNPADIPQWRHGSLPESERARLISLSLRPAPVTDQWIIDGPRLPDLVDTVANLTLLEAPTPRSEAGAIAVRLRQALDEGKTAALVTPDRNLTRQVTSALERWGILPDDSAGVPLQLTPPARFLRHVAELMAEGITTERLLTLLKHPLCHAGKSRGPHILFTAELELHLRRYGPPFPSADDIRIWGSETDEHQQAWAHWLADQLAEISNLPHNSSLKCYLETQIQIGERLSAGPEQTDQIQLWQKSAGRETRRLMDDLKSQSDVAGELTPHEFRILTNKVLASSEVRDRDAGHPDILIWGTMEARVQSADLVILGGLNEGTWPEAQNPDPWLNRRMRMQAGLLLPERRIGLAAHDYQIAANAPEVVLSRSIRSDEAENVASRWINRLVNLLGGLPENRGDQALEQMRLRGHALLSIAAQLEKPDTRIAPAPRPSPSPPPETRPKQLSVTQIKTLIRDPYAIYARTILGLKPLDPLIHNPDALLRGNIIHEVLEQFISEAPDLSDPLAKHRLREIAQDVLRRTCPWPVMKRLWLARIDRFSDSFLAGEVARQRNATPIGFELWGEAKLDGLDFTLTAKADRMDRSKTGEIYVYDYKTGAAPTPMQQKHYDKQLLLEAAMVERGAFRSIGTASVPEAAFIQLSAEVKSIQAPLSETPASEVWAAFTKLMLKWAGTDHGYTARRSNMKLSDRGDYDHLARYGEWDETQDPLKEQF